jgi:hypothetical protein
MLVAFQDMLGPPLHKLFLCALHFNLAVELLVLVPERNSPRGNKGDAMLRDGGVTSGVSARVFGGNALYRTLRVPPSECS